MHRLRTVAAALIVVLVASLAHAFEFPPDAEFIVTDAQGVIVAIGRSVDGATVSVEVWSEFEGPARLTLFLGDGRTRAVDVAIEDGVVVIEGVDLRVLLAEVFEHVSVAFVAEPGASGHPPGPAQDEVPDDDGEAGGGDEPPGQDRRPEDPPGQERRPDEPPGQERRPDEPPGQDPGSDGPPGEERRPEEPPGQDRRPDEVPGTR